MAKKEPISRGSEWTFPLLQKYDQEISRIAKDFKLETYPNQIEVISSEQMLDAYASLGMPVSYNHWSFGKKLVDAEKQYKRGKMGLAYELVINSNPCIAYLMEENTMAMQALVIAHACYGHNSFFKNNYLFKMWTSADSIIDYLVFARKYISECEHKYGIEEVENIIDSCHALMNYGVDRYVHPPKLSIQEEKIRQQNREVYLQSQVNDLWRTIPISEKLETEQKHKQFPEEPQENILYFLEKNAPLLESWQREIIRIVRKIAQYFYPQGQTKVMNEGWACFWHYTIINAMYDEGLVTDEFMLEFIQSHTGVIHQPDFDSPYFSGINPYTLGFNMMQEIRRVSESPTEEDKIFFPQIANTPWRKNLEDAMQNFKDESFIAQYLSPKLIRDLRLFKLTNKNKDPFITISEIHDNRGYQNIRQSLSKQYNLSLIEPNIQVYKVNIESNRELTLKHIINENKPLSKNNTNEVMKHIYRLWKFPIKIISVDENNNQVKEYKCPMSSQNDNSK